jgi:hypothetical protein
MNASIGLRAPVKGKGHEPILSQVLAQIVVVAAASEAWNAYWLF